MSVGPTLVPPPPPYNPPARSPLLAAWRIYPPLFPAVFALLTALIPDGLVVLIGSYLFWVGGSFAVLYGDLHKRPLSPGDWGPLQWGATCFVAGGLALPLYFWTTHSTGPALARGIFLGLLVTFLTLVVRVGLSLYLQVPLA